MMALDWRGRYHSKESAVNLFQPGCSLSKLRAVPPFRRVPSRELNKKNNKRELMLPRHVELWNAGMRHMKSCFFFTRATEIAENKGLLVVYSVS